MNQEPDIRADRGDHPLPPKAGPRWLLWLAAAVIVGVVAAWIWRSQKAPPPPAPVAAVTEPAPAPEPPASAPAAPAIRYPLAEDPASQPVRAEEVPAALADLLGAKAVTAFLQTDGFARRVVATIDSLGREHSPPAAWPVQPTGGRFTVDEQADGPVIAAENASRYTPFVLLVGTLDVQRTVNLYRRLYPLLQQTYRELGFGDRYLNDRVIEVIDLLLATPEPAAPPRLRLTEVKGPVPSTRPWVRYQYADPQLESLAAGQKILVRVGPVNERRLKAKLAELRQHILAGAAPAAPPPGVSASAPARPASPAAAR